LTPSSPAYVPSSVFDAFSRSPSMTAERSRAMERTRPSRISSRARISWSAAVECWPAVSRPYGAV
jgi:hypothetical protein